MSHISTAKGKHAPQPGKSTPIMVHTVFGHSILSSDTRVYVRLGDAYVPKAAGEVRPGEQVLFRKDGIPGVTLEDVDAVLAQSSRYATTAPVLFRRFSDGSYTTAFHHALMSGMASNPASWPASIARANSVLKRILSGERVELDFPQKADAAIEIIAKLKDAGAPAVTEGHAIHGWLGGMVIAPRNRDRVFPALQPLAPGLGALLQPAFADAYRLYVAIRQNVMRAISIVLTGNASPLVGGTPGNAPGTTLSTGPEIALVVDHFASSISSTHAAGRVVRVEELHGKGPAAGHEEGELFRGIVAVQAEPGMAIKQLSEVLREMSVLYPVFERILNDFLDISHIGIVMVNGPMFQCTRSSVVEEAVATALGYYEHREFRHARFRQMMERAGIQQLDRFYPSDAQKVAKTGIDLAKQERGMEAIGRAFIEQLNGGRLDAFYGLPPSTLQRFIDYYLSLERALPYDTQYLNNLRRIMAAKENAARDSGQAISTKAERVEIGEVERRLTRKYGILFNRFGFASAIITAGTLLGSHAGSGEKISAPEFGRLAESLSQKGVEIADEEVALRAIREAGFGELAGLYPKASDFTGLH